MGEKVAQLFLDEDSPSIDQENKDHINSNVAQNHSSQNNALLKQFEKPTQIYRYLRTRHIVSPIFLYRTLSYMRHRMSRSHKKGKLFKLEQMLETVLKKKMDSEKSCDNLLIIGARLFDKNCVEMKTASLTFSLLKHNHTRRRDCLQPIETIPIDKLDVPINPKDKSAHCRTLTISKEHLNPSDSHLVKSYSMNFTVVISNLSNGEQINSSDSSTNQPSSNSINKRIKLSSPQNLIKTEYSRKLVIIDEKKQCQLTNGEYQIVLEESTKSSNDINKSPKISTWEVLPQKQASDTSTVEFEKGPILVFTLVWTDIISDSVIYSPKLITNHMSLLNGFSDVEKNGHKKNGHVNGKSSDTGKAKPYLNGHGKKPAKMKVIYRFTHNDVVIQQTKPNSDGRCAWCAIKCQYITALIKHLTCCHQRFHFSLVSDVKGFKIDVSMNKSFDGSYSGNPHDLSHVTTGYAFSKNGPSMRAPMTEIIFVKNRYDPRYKLDSPMYDDNDSHLEPKPFLHGHNRLYFQSSDCIPILPPIQDISDDSEAEIDPEWLKIKTSSMIDDFTDVNEGEKEVMKLWNLHQMKHCFVGDCQMSAACDRFVDEHGIEILQRNLYRNFLLHLNNLFDFGILSANVMLSTIRRLNNLRKQALIEKESDETKIMEVDKEEVESK